MRYSIINILLFGFLGSLAIVNPGFAQEDPQAMMSVGEVKNEKILKITLPIQMMVNLLHLNVYEAAVGDLSACQEDGVCLTHAQRIKNVKCLNDVCKDQNRNRRPIDCFEELQKKHSSEKLNQLDSLICPLLNSPNEQAKKKLFDLQQNFTEEDLAKAQAYVMAMNGDADKCQDHIKKFVGEFGLKWDYQSYAALAGCRILARQSTVEEEERNFYIWYGTQDKWKCSNIINSDVRLSCHNSKVKAPRLAQDQSSFSVEALVKHLYFQTYDVGSGVESACVDDQQCLDNVNRIKPWLCMAYICSGKDNTRETADCFKGLEAYYPGVETEKVNGACNLLRLFDEKDQKTLASYLPGVTNDDLIEYAAYIQALNRSAESCRDFITRHIGEDQSLWTYRWYRALSGCNILARELTIEQEEAGYYIWYVMEQNFKCSDIKNDALKQACSTPGAVSPVILDEK